MKVTCVQLVVLNPLQNFKLHLSSELEADAPPPNLASIRAHPPSHWNSANLTLGSVSIKSQLERDNSSKRAKPHPGILWFFYARNPEPDGREAWGI
jgi:hypothetical protein